VHLLIRELRGQLVVHAKPGVIRRSDAIECPRVPQRGLRMNATKLLKTKTPPFRLWLRSTSTATPRGASFVTKMTLLRMLSRAKRSPSRSPNDAMSRRQYRFTIGTSQKSEASRSQFPHCSIRVVRKVIGSCVPAANPKRSASSRPLAVP
jgi:hypothetical protein